jgi:hypothetical protein
VIIVRTTRQRASGLAAIVAVALLGIGMLNGTASSAPPAGREVVITDPTTPTRQAAVGADGALRVSQQGTTDVNVVNGSIAVSQNGPWTIGGTVQLAPTEPVQADGNTTFAADEGVAVIDVYTVPDGKRLVAQHVSVHALLGTGNLYSAELQDGVPFGPHIHDLVVTAQGNDNLGRNVFTASEEVSFVLEPGATLGVVVRRDSEGEGGFIQASVSGYLVSA